MLSTALFVMGLDRGLALLREFVGVDALIVLKNVQTVKTAGFPVA
jgi:thiamine biosynthesis lipoprotein ApbE